MIDVAYIVRPGEDNAELRYSLRSLRNVPHGDVWIFGHCPSWVQNVHRVFVTQRDPRTHKYENGRANLTAIVDHGPNKFALFNDDFFCVRPTESMPAPGHRGTLRELAVSRPGDYGALLRETDGLLTRSGLVDPLAYTLHKPMTMQRGALGYALEYGADKRVSWRSIVGNLYRYGGMREDDVKVPHDGPLPRGPWVSTIDASFRYHPVGEAIRRALPSPSPYEQV